MIKVLKYITIVFILCCFTSCEKTEIVDLDISGDEYIVIRSEVSTNEMFQGVNITKTLQSGIKYDIKLAEIKDAYAYIQINQKQIIPLHYTTNGVYKPLYNLRVNEGDVYEFFAKIHGKPVYAKTRAPFKPNISSVIYTQGHYLQALVNPFADQVYGAVWTVSSEVASDYYSIEIPGSSESDYLLQVRTEEIPLKYQGKEYDGSRSIIIYSFDKSYFDYFKSKGSSGTSENIFTQGGSNSVKWNVSGDKVIGLFIGVAKGSKLGSF